MRQRISGGEAGHPGVSLCAFCARSVWDTFAFPHRGRSLITRHKTPAGGELFPAGRRLFLLYSPVMIRMISRSVWRMPMLPTRPTLASVFSTPLRTMPSPS